MWLFDQPIGHVEVARYVPRLDLDLGALVCEDILMAPGSCARPGCGSIGGGFHIPATGLSGVFDDRYGLCQMSFSRRLDLSREFDLDPNREGETLLDASRVYENAGPCEVLGARECRNLICDSGLPELEQFYALHPTIDAVANGRKRVATVALMCLTWKIVRCSVPSCAAIGDFVGARPDVFEDAFRIVVYSGLRVFPDGPHLGPISMLDERRLIADLVFATRNRGIIQRWSERIIILDENIKQMVGRRNPKALLTVCAARIAFGLLVPSAVNKSGDVTAYALAEWLDAIEGIENVPERTVGRYLEMLPACLRIL